MLLDRKELCEEGFRLHSIQGLDLKRTRSREYGCGVIEIICCWTARSCARRASDCTASRAWT